MARIPLSLSVARSGLISCFFPLYITQEEDSFSLPPFTLHFALDVKKRENKILVRVFYFLPRARFQPPKQPAASTDFSFHGHPTPSPTAAWSRLQVCSAHDGRLLLLTRNPIQVKGIESSAIEWAIVPTVLTLTMCSKLPPTGCRTMVTNMRKQPMSREIPADFSNLLCIVVILYTQR